MGVFKVPVALKNWQNRFLPEEKRGEDLECEAIVDSDALELALPAELVERLRLEETGQIRVRTADGIVHDKKALRDRRSDGPGEIVPGWSHRTASRRAAHPWSPSS